MRPHSHARDYQVCKTAKSVLPTHSTWDNKHSWNSSRSSYVLCMNKYFQKSTGGFQRFFLRLFKKTTNFQHLTRNVNFVKIIPAHALSINRTLLFLFPFIPFIFSYHFSWRIFHHSIIFTPLFSFHSSTLNTSLTPWHLFA